MKKITILILLVSFFIVFAVCTNKVADAPTNNVSLSDSSKTELDSYNRIDSTGEVAENTISKSELLNDTYLTEGFDTLCIISQCSSYGTEDCLFYYSNDLILTNGYEPKVWKINCNDGTNVVSDELELEGFKHLHTANLNNKNEWFFTGADYNNEYYIVKVFNGSIVSKIKLDRLPYRTYLFDDTVIVLLRESDHIGKLYKVDFLTGKIGYIADYYCENTDKSESMNGSNSVFTYKDKLFYKSGPDKWKLYLNNSVDSYEIKGFCGGFLDEDTVVFYQNIIEKLPVSSISNMGFSEVGKIQKISLSTGDSKESKTLKLPFGVCANMFMSSDGKSLLLEYGTLDDNHNGLVINMNDYTFKEMYWYPSGGSNISIVYPNS